MHITKKQREIIKQKFGGHCAYCGEILGDKFHVDHVKPLMRYAKYHGGFEIDRPENHTMDNFYPACACCNLFKATWNIEQFRHELQMQVIRARKMSKNFRMSEKFGLISIIEKPIVFYFETYNENNSI
jgi:5-methylcytosine-specific restriction endonuclease McrA